MEWTFGRNSTKDSSGPHPIQEPVQTRNGGKSPGVDRFTDTESKSVLELFVAKSNQTLWGVL
jgi:hypothetical protein